MTDAFKAPATSFARTTPTAMKLRALESLLEGVDAFETPKVALEQYPTSPHIAARIVHTAESFGDIRDRVVVDLGCGGGVLTLGAALCGAGHVVGIDIDADAISLTASNAAQFEDVFVDVLHAHVTHLPPSLRADTVIMNPPFGTRVKGADIEFLRAATKIARKAIYSLHKSSTRDHVRRIAETQCSLSAQVIAELRFDIPQMYAFHRDQSRDVQVDLWRFAPEAG